MVIADVMRSYPLGLKPSEVLKELSWAEIIVLLEHLSGKPEEKKTTAQMHPAKVMNSLEEW